MYRKIERETLTVEETGVLLGIGRNQAYEAIKNGSIPSIRFGRRIVVPRAQLTQMLRSAVEDNDDKDPASLE
ncbi:hypothetical protein A9Q83_11455 [Alphaproteobacteria bacterium 46_93_T64]|nr:hypothetical protein A9Q83_11455 [Alphaproteobacteria bacterium 46_93_T64]